MRPRADSFLDDEESLPGPSADQFLGGSSSAESYLDGSDAAGAGAQETPKRRSASDFLFDAAEGIQNVEEKAGRAIAPIVSRAAPFVRPVINAVAPELPVIYDAFRKAEPVTRPIVESPVTGLGGLIALGQGRTVQEAAEGIKAGKTAGDYVREAIPEPQSRSVAANVLGNLGRAAAGEATDLGIYAGPFEAPRVLGKLRAPRMPELSGPPTPEVATPPEPATLPEKPYRYSDFEAELPPEERITISRMRQKLAETPHSTEIHKVPETGEYTPERQAIHDEIVNQPKYARPETFAPEGEQPVARFVIGPPGAGKTTAINEFFDPADMKRFANLDADELKAALPDYDPSVAGKFHQESTDLHERVLGDIMDRRQNFVDQVVGRDSEALQRKIRGLKNMGYKVELYLVDADPKVAANRALSRFKEQGRYVDPGYIIDDVGLKPRETYGKLKAEVDAYGHIKTDVPPGQPPELIEGNIRRAQVLRGDGRLRGEEVRGDNRASGGEVQGGASGEVPAQVSGVKPTEQPQPNLEKLYPKEPTGEEGAVSLGAAERPGEPSFAQKAKQELYDRFEPIKYAEGKEIAPEAPGAGGKYTESYVQARTLSGRVKARGEALLDEVNAAVEPLKDNADRQALNKIYTLRNFADLDRMGKTTSGVTAEVADAELAKLREEIGPDRFDRIAKVADTIADIQNNKGLDILVEGKVITSEAAQAYREKYPNYLRSEIVGDELAADHPELRSSPRDNAEPLGKVNRSFLKEKKGTEKTINTDVLDVVRRSLLSKVAAAEKQKTIDTIVRDFGQDISRERILKEGGAIIDADPSKIPAGYVKSQVKASNGRIYAVRKDVEAMLQGLNREQMDLVTKTMSSFNRVFKGGATTYRAPFVMSNLFRDAQEFFLKGRSVEGQGNRVAAYIKGSLAATQEALHDAFPKWIPENGLATAWKEQGGAFGGIVTSIGHAKPIPFRLLGGKEKMGRLVGKALMLPFEPIRVPAEVMENATRLAEYSRLKGTKLPEPLKILNSRDVTVDFEKMGDSLRVWNNAIPFLNPSVQGAINIARAVRDQPLITAGKATAYIVVPQIGLYAYNRKFKNDDLVDPYIKDNFWYINTGAEREVNGRMVPVLWTIRKGEAAQLLSNPVRRALEYYSKDPNFQNALDDYSLKGIANSAANFAAPPLLKVPFEEAANYSTFQQGPIVSDRLKDVDPKYQFNAGTTNTARVIGEKTGLSPARIEHVAQGLYPASKQALEASDAILKPKPLLPRREKDPLERSRTFQPLIRTPSGYFSQEEDASRRFEQKAKEEKRTPAFLYEEARKRYMETRADEDLERMIELAKDVPGDQRIRINRRVNELLRQKAGDSETRATMRLPRKMRRLFRQSQGGQEE